MAGEATGQPFRFTGRRYDAETGLYYYRARYYSPILGRFLQTDAIGYGDNMNMYAYVGNDPINATDPTGMFFQGSGRGHSGSTGKLLSLVADFTPIVGDIKGIAEAIADPIAVNIAAAAIGLVPVVGDIAGKGLKALSRACSFTPGTLVLTQNGLIPIELLEVGDIVLAEDPETGAQDWKSVIELLGSDDRPIYELRIETADGLAELQQVTGNHPYWVIGEGWLWAEKLEPGMVVDTADGRGATVSSLSATGRTSSTHNLEIADLHTYFVGASQTLVHNACNVNPGTLKPTQPKSDLNNSQLKRMTNDMKEGGFDGPPVKVSETPDGNQFVTDGHHRTLAAEKAGLNEIPADVKKVDGDEAQKVRDDFIKAKCQDAERCF